MSQGKEKEIEFYELEKPIPEGELELFVQICDSLKIKPIIDKQGNVSYHTSPLTSTMLFIELHLHNIHDIKAKRQ